jgi:hypothetical protein
MNLKNKLKGIPSIYYVNLDNRTDRREYMESQFDYWNITNYQRISATKYLGSKFDEWKYLISNEREYVLRPAAVANSITHLEMIKNWLETTDESCMIMMEDDYDLSLIEYWNFDWEYLMNHIPYDWDCIQLGYEAFNYIHFFLHPKIPATYFGACMINRFYAQKLIRLYFDNGKFIVDNEKNDIRHIEKGHARGTLDYSICENGRIYCIPLIPQRPDITSFEDCYQRDYISWQHVYKTYELYYDWWKNYHHKFSLEDFFTYGKSNDGEMTRKVKMESIKKTMLYQ